MPYYFYASLLANRGCIFSLSSFGRSLASLDGLFACRSCIEFERPVVFVHSCVHNRLRPRELIGCTENSRFLSQFKFKDMAKFSVCRLWSVWALSKLEKCRKMLIMTCMLVLNANNAVHRYPPLPEECPFKTTFRAHKTRVWLKNVHTFENS